MANNQNGRVHVGGSFAPPLTPDLLASYESIIARCTNQRWREAMQRLHAMATAFLETPESSLPGTPHPSGRGVVVPLEQSEIERIWDHVPYDYECDAIGTLFSEIPESDRDTRNAAHHLLWYAKELTLDREPITTDKI